MRMLSSAGEPGILPVLDVDPGEAPSWFIMPKAQMLAEVLGNSPDLRDVVEVVAQLAATLDRLKDAYDIVHRDIKPENLFYYEGKPVLGDFGIAAWPDPSRHLCNSIFSGRCPVSSRFE